MLSRHTPIEEKARLFGDAIRMFYAGRGKTREQFAAEADLAVEVVTGVVHGQAHRYDRALLNRLVGALKSKADEERRLLEWVVEMTPNGFGQQMN